MTFNICPECKGMGIITGTDRVARTCMECIGRGVSEKIRKERLIYTRAEEVEEVPAEIIDLRTDASEPLPIETQVDNIISQMPRREGIPIKITQLPVLRKRGRPTKIKQ